MYPSLLALSDLFTLVCVQEGSTTIGSVDFPRRLDIVLHGAGISDEHCIIKYHRPSSALSGADTEARREGEHVYLHPHYQALCSVNGVPITEPTKLTQGKYRIYR